jgi:hypothetical protein
MRIVGLLVSVAIIILATIFVIKGNPNAPTRKDGKGTTTLGRTRMAAFDEKCKSNISQARQFIDIGTDPVDGTKPDSMSSAKVPPDFQKCPIEPYEPYTYDPNTGQIHCPHPGHENY